MPMHSDWHEHSGEFQMRKQWRGTVWRNAARTLVACLLFAAVAAAPPGWALTSGTSGPGPSAGAVSAAARQVSKREAAVNAARVQLAEANTRLASLRVKAEVVIERYDKTMVAMHQAAVAYRAAEARLTRAAAAEQQSRRQVAALAAQDYESGSGFGSMAAMLGNSGGPQAFLNGADAEQQLAQQGTDVLSQDRASKVVASVFRAQARQALDIEQAAARRAKALKIAVQAALQRQLAAVQASQASTRRLEKELGAARAHAFELQQARQRALAAAAARQRALQAQQAQQAAAASSSGSGGSGGFTPTIAPGGSSTWASSFSLAQGASAAQGNEAADWALSQLGKPYQWGAAGPNTYDCSGLTMMAWAHAGVQLQHWTGFQWPSGPHIPISQLRRGDLVFYATDTSAPATIHHVGIYIGNGQMVDAPYTGVDVRIDSIFWPGLIGATRPAG
jgi:cell wall-associated NlpC family hydrolase